MGTSPDSSSKEWAEARPCTLDERACPSAEETYLTIVVSFYNEAGRIETTLEAIDVFADSKPYHCQVLLSDDHSTDHSVALAKRYHSDGGRFRYLAPLPDQPQGKGAGIRRGILEADGKYIMFMDADGSTPISEIDKLLSFTDRFDIVMGSRYIREARLFRPGYVLAVLHGLGSLFEVLIFGHSLDCTASCMQGRLRQFISRGGNLLFTLLLNQSYVDQRCGFKLYRGNAAKLLANLQTLPSFGFDTEYLSIAQAHELTTVEVPVEWRDAGSSRVDPVRDTLGSFRDLFAVVKNTIDGKYSRKYARKELGSLYDEYAQGRS